MCGRYTSTSAPADLAKAFAVDDIKVEQLPIRYNVAPTQDVYAVASRRPKSPEEAVRRQLGAFRWGLIPSWAKDPSIGSKMINARAEEIETKSAYRKALVRRRCIIPADSFYEWQVRSEPGATAAEQRKGRLPYVVGHHDGSLMAFAGLWEVWRPPALASLPLTDTELIRSCVIITTAANEYLAPIHGRMPAILAPSVWDRWLDPGLDDVTAIKRLLVAAPSGDFTAYPVSTLVNDVAHEGPDLIAPLPPPPRAV